MGIIVWLLIFSPLSAHIDAKVYSDASCTCNLPEGTNLSFEAGKLTKYFAFCGHELGSPESCFPHRHYTCNNGNKKEAKPDGASCINSRCIGKTPGKRSFKDCGDTKDASGTVEKCEDCIFREVKDNVTGLIKTPEFDRRALGNVYYNFTGELGFYKTWELVKMKRVEGSNGVYEEA